MYTGRPKALLCFFCCGLARVLSYHLEHSAALLSVHINTRTPQALEAPLDIPRHTVIHPQIALDRATPARQRAAGTRKQQPSRGRCVVSQTPPRTARL